MKIQLAYWMVHGSHQAAGRLLPIVISKFSNYYLSAPHANGSPEQLEVFAEAWK